MALSQGKKIEERPGREYQPPVAAGAVIYQGGLVMLDTGVAKKAAPGADAAAAAKLAVIGIAEKSVTGGAANGDVKVPVRSGVFLFKNSAGADLIAMKDVLAAAYVVDDETVALTSNTNVRPKAGTIVDVESAGVWVKVGA